jgi:hypothetical protein
MIISVKSKQNIILWGQGGWGVIILTLWGLVGWVVSTKILTNKLY